MCADAGVALETLAKAAGVPGSYVRRIVAGTARPSIETYAKLAVPLGADLATRLYPNTGPLIRDRHQARIVEALLGQLHPRWRATTEVGVTRPARGWIDVVLHDPREALFVAVEIESDIRRIEQQLRWSRMKADALPSWADWPGGARGSDGPDRAHGSDGPRGDSPDGDRPGISQLLIVRRTRATRQTATEFVGQLSVAYPAHPDDALSALTGTAQWPGPARVWAQIEPDRVRFLPTR